ncbi:MAG TPA: TIGR02757 family protein [Bacteroidales bacterium]|nr:TIGR02757 family protein [Bacteroidales bacterium]
MPTQAELKAFLDDKAARYNNPAFVELDPIQVPHSFTLKEDIEISGFLAATIAWGNRASIVKNAKRMMGYLGASPYDFILHHNEKHLEKMEGFVHRTFNSTDLLTFVEGLKHLYKDEKGLEGVFMRYQTKTSLQPAIHELKSEFFKIPHLKRTLKHLPDPLTGSAAKRINMFLRWMVRNDDRGVDFGIWKSVSPSILSCPLDVHSGNVARKLGILTRKQNDAKAVAELDAVLRSFDPEDPVKYDFALFGTGIDNHNCVFPD